MNRKQQDLFERIKAGQTSIESVMTFRRGRRPTTSGRGDLTTLESMVPAEQVSYCPGGYKRHPVVRIITKEEVRIDYYPTDADKPGSKYSDVVTRYNVEVI